MPGAQAQSQDANKQIGDLVAEISVLSKQVCGVTAPTDADAKKLYDERQQILLDDAKKLITLLDQQKPTGSGILDKRSADDIAGWEKSLTVDPNNPKSCPVVPSDLQKYATGSAPLAASIPSQQVKVAPASVTFDQPQTIGTLSTPTTVTITNTSTDNLDIFVWYGLHLDNFWVSDDTCNGITPPQGSCTFKVAFAPKEMPALDNKELYTTLWIVKHQAWREFEKVRLAYKQITDAQAVINDAALKVRNQVRVVKSMSDIIQFCEGETGRKVDACTDLNSANTALNKIQVANRNSKTLDQAVNELRNNALASVPLEGTPIHWKYPLTRAVVGLDLSAISSQTVRQAYFVDFNLLVPFKFPWFKANQDALESRWWFWLNPRITSLPKAADPSAIATIDEAGTFFTNFSNQNHTADIAQGFDVNGGVEMALLKPRDGIPWWGEYVNTQARLGISLIGGAGVSTPFSVPDTDVTLQVNQGICDAFKTQTPAMFQGTPVSDRTGLVCSAPSAPSNLPQVLVPNPAFDPTNSMSPKTVGDPFISFFTPERTRFFRRYYGGFRLKTYFFSPDVKGECDPKRKDRCDAPYDIFPGIIDVTAGQDEAVTKGKLTRVLFRVEAVYPLPFVPGFHVFGSIYTSFKRNTQEQPFNTFPINAPTSGLANDSNTFRFPLMPLDRDYFRLGVGVDLIQLLKRNKGGQPTTTTSASSGQSGSSSTTSSASSATSPNQ